MTLFLRVLDAPADGKAAALRDAIAGNGSTFERDPGAFSAVPGSPFAYWVSDRLRAASRDRISPSTPGRSASANTSDVEVALRPAPLPDGIATSTNRVALPVADWMPRATTVSP